MTSIRNSPRQRRSLRQSLKDFLRLIPGLSDKTQTVGSGILRRADPSVSYLPRLSTISLFPDFGSSQFDIEQRPTSTYATNPTTTSAFDSIREPTQQSLLPATSLSHFNLRDTYVKQAGLPQHVVYGSVNNAYLPGASRQASIATFTTSSVRRSASTLRLGQSTTTSLTSLSSLSQETIRSTYPRSDSSKTTLDNYRTGLPHNNRHVAPTSKAGSKERPPQCQSIQRDPLTLVEHFKSFCVLDTAMAGSPVTATSAELRYIFEIGEKFFLNNRECQEASMDIVTGSDAAGNQVTHLVLFSPLVSPSSGRSRFMLACLVDVTEFICETATLPQLDSISEEDSVIEEAPTPPLSSSRTPWDSTNHGLSVEDLLGGCSISERPTGGRLERKPSDDIWLALAATEGKVKPSPRQERQLRRATEIPSTPAFTSTTSSVDDVLEQFVASLQSLYSDFFLLGNNPLDDNVYEICNVSPKVYASKEYVEGHLSKTPREDIGELSARLSGDCAFSRPVNWGTRGKPKQLYCSPLYGQSSLTWICFLVDEHAPKLW